MKIYKMPNSEPKVQGCDARDDDSSNVAGNQNTKPQTRNWQQSLYL